MKIQFQNKLFYIVIYTILVSSLSSCAISKCRYSNGFRIDLGGRSQGVVNSDKKTKYCKMKSFKKMTTQNSIPNLAVNDSVGMSPALSIPKTEKENTKFTNSLIENKVSYSNKEKTSSKAIIKSKKIKRSENKTSVLVDVLLEILKALLFIVLLALIVVVMAYLFVALLFLINADIGLVLVLFFLFLIVTIALMVLLTYLFGYGMQSYRHRTPRLNFLGSGRTSLFRFF
jgi:ABC-type multidrug transport system fused ATPase/permease subunit